MITTILFIGFIVGVSFLGIYLPVKIVEMKQQKTCPACKSGTVAFTDRGQELCHKHWERWDRINQLEQALDFDMRLEVGRTEQEQRADALDLLLEKLSVPEGRTVRLQQLDGTWVHVEIPEEAGAVSPKTDGSR